MSIKLQNVMKNFGKNAASYMALKGISLSIETGEFVSIVGKSGSGKSTLMNMITGIDHPSSGEVCVLGVDIHSLKRSQMSKWRGRNIGIVFQFFQLMPTLSLLENVILPMDLCKMYTKKERLVRAGLLLEKVGIGELAHKLPSEISGGQQQRAAIARALANDPPIIIADEPTGSLDEKTSNEIIGLFEDLSSSGKTIVIVTHDRALAQRAHRSIILSDGVIALDDAAGLHPKNA